MEDTNQLVGQFARLPDGQKVMIESQDGSPAWATVRRIGGQHDGTRAVCLVSKLESYDSNVPVAKRLIRRGKLPVTEALILPDLLRSRP
jgi:hypothetical protein